MMVVIVSEDEDSVLNDFDEKEIDHEVAFTHYMQV